MEVGILVLQTNSTEVLIFTNLNFFFQIVAKMATPSPIPAGISKEQVRKILCPFCLGLVRQWSLCLVSYFSIFCDACGFKSVEPSFRSFVTLRIKYM